MKQLKIKFTGQSFVSGQIMKPIRVGFKRAVKVRNKKEKDMKGKYNFIPKDAPKHYGIIEVIITGTDGAIEKEAEELKSQLYSLVMDIEKRNPTLKNKIRSSLARFGFKLLKPIKKLLVTAYLSMGILVEWDVKEVQI